MVDKDKAKMVLRTVYLPFELDQQLREAAFYSQQSKGELIRSLIAEALEARGTPQVVGVSVRKTSIK